MKTKSCFFILFITILSSAFGQNHLNIEDLSLYTPTNRAFKCHIDGKDYFFRIGRANPELIGIDREREIRGFKIGGELGISPTIIGYEINNGLLITEFLDGKMSQKERMHDINFRNAIVKNFQLLHNYPADVNMGVEKNMIDVCRNGYENAKHLLEDENEVHPWIQYLESFADGYYDDCEKGYCHGDIYFGNLLEDASGKLYFIDWEFSFFGYIIDDLGKFCSDLTEDEIFQVVKEYWGNAEMFHKAKQNAFMHSLFHFFWTYLQGQLDPTNKWYAYRADLMRDYLNHFVESEGARTG